jgi:SAM-dependent methyltransferase
MRCLDLGCGIGEVTRRMAQWVGPEGQAVGIDVNEPFVVWAQHEAQRLKLSPVFRTASAVELNESSAFDLVYARFLLSHLPGPERIIERMLLAARPGGVVAVEDIDFPGHFSWPPCPALARYVDLYQEVVRHNGGDAAIGPRLPGLFRAAGFAGVRFRIVQPTREAHRLAAVTMEHVRDKVLAASLASASEVDTLIRELNSFGKDPQNLMSLPRIFQVWGRRP